MSKTLGFLATDGESALVIEWFTKHPELAHSAERPDGKWFAFGAAPSPGAQLDPKTSPLVYVAMPTRLRGVLWGAGEVGFTATSLREQFPRLHAIQKQFSSWLSQFDLVFAQRPPSPSQWNYYLEGGLRNRDVDLYALPNAARDLRTGQYFVRHGISEPELDQLCGVLRLRGVAC